MNAIAKTFETLRARDEMALVVFLTAGFPTIDASMRSLSTLAAAGADVIELGIPFADPVADGPTIQRSSHTALAAGATLRGILDALADTSCGVPVSLMSYLNPLIAYGREPLLDRLARIGVSGLIVPDLPLEETCEWSASAARRGLALTLLAAPTSTDERLRAIAERTAGFLYYVSVTGVTGTRDELPTDLIAAVDRVRGRTRVPIAVGFGISTAAHVRLLRGHADGVVVGSRIVQAIERGEDLAPLIHDLKAATRPIPNPSRLGEPAPGVEPC